ncbi:MAG: glycosyltransferase [Bacteroidota bacterium]
MIEQLLFWLLIFLGSMYAIIHLCLWIGLNRLVNPHSESVEQPISVIVAARNEEKVIGSLLQSLVDQQYSSEKFEIIIVNDRSIDSTASIIEKFQKQYRHVRLITIEENTTDMPHKKNALRTAIEQSQFEILAFTDADCIVPKNWLRELSKQFMNDVGAVAGYSPYTLNTSNSFLRYEEYKNSLLAASAVELKNAFMCTGRNFAYRKKVYKEVNGFETIKHSISGDDDLFLQVLKRKTNWNIRYMISRESYVRTLPPSSFSQFVNQRTRHVSASKFYSKHIQLAYSVIHLFHLSVIIGFFISPLIALIFLMIKLNIDGALIAHGKTIFHEEFSTIEFSRNELLLVLYSFLIAPLGIIRTFEWKGTSAA